MSENNLGTSEEKILPEQNNSSEQKSPEKNTTMAIIAYIIFFIPLLTGDAKKDSYVNYHTKQGLVLFLLAVVVRILNWIMPFYFWYRIGWLLSLVLLVFLVIGIMSASKGEEKPLPVVGELAKKFKF